MGANSRLREWVAVISLQGWSIADIRSLIFPRIDDFLLDTGVADYGYILHDKDLKDDGELKIPHVHLVASYPQGKRNTRWSTWVNKLADYLGLDVRSISLDSCVSFDSSLQYLIHKNDIDKFQYPLEEVKSSYDLQELNTIMQREVKSFTIDYAIRIIDECETLTEAIKVFGLKIYYQYRNIIKDLWNDKDNKHYCVGYQDE